MRGLVESLESCVRQSTFVSDRSGRMGWSAVRERYRNRQWNDHGWWIVNSARLEVPDEPVSHLAAELAPVLRECLHADTERIGNGLFLLMGGVGTWAHPTLFDFAKLLIPGAVKIGSERVADLLLQWAGGEPLRLRQNALLEGMTIERLLSLEEGIHLQKLPTSALELPASLPFFVVGSTVTDYLGGVMLSVDCEVSSTLYLPTDEEIRGASSRQRSFKLARDSIPNLSFDSFCESMSLAGNGHVDWFVQWQDYGDLEGFALAQSSVSYKHRSGFHHGPKFTQDHLNAARTIHHTRHAGGQPKESLDLAMRRWIRSKRPGTDSDKLIELRIALEALYEIGGLSEKGFRISTYGAWHLGETFEQRCAYRETLRKVYDDASRAVHAGKLKHARKSPELVSNAQDICREGILKRLQEPEMPKWDDLILGKRV